MQTIFIAFLKVEMQRDEKVPPATAGGKYLLSPKTKVYLGLCICGKLNSYYNGADITKLLTGGKETLSSRA